MSPTGQASSAPSRQSSAGTTTLSVIVMAYNEADSLPSVLDELHHLLEARCGDAEIIVVDDGSGDDTGAIADRLAADKSNVIVVHHETNRGIGEVYRSGFARARGDHVTFVPADGQFDPAFIPPFSDEIERGADLVLGYLPEQGTARRPFARLLSVSEKLLYRLMFGPMPPFQGVMMFRRELLDHLFLRSAGRGWVILTELIVRARGAGYRAVSRPTSLRSRASGHSKVNNLPTIVANLRQAFALWRALRREVAD